MQSTAHYGLQKPDPNDTYNKATDNGNMDAIDSQLYAMMQAVFGSTSVVLSGGVATKDASTATQLDVTSAVVYFGTGQAYVFSASAAAQFVTATASTTYYLDYNSDGTVSWGTAHSAKAGYVTICSVTTDASGNISVVTDARPMTAAVFGSDSVTFASQVQAQKFKGDGSQLTNLPIPTVNNATSTAAGISETTQNVTGTPVVSTRVADQEELELTTTAATTIATFTPTKTGMFDIACHFRITANSNVGIAITYEGVNGALTTTVLNSTAYTFNAAAGADNEYDTIPVTIRAVAGTAINVQFTASVANAVYATANITGR